MAAAHPDWVAGFADACWRGRLAQPALHAWTEAGPLRLHERTRPAGDADPKARARYGLLRAGTGELLLRSVVGRPVGQVTEDFLAWGCDRLAAEGKRVLVLVWGNAAWHVGKRVRAWAQAHNRRVKEAGAGVHVLPCRLPIEAPWLNPIEPQGGTASAPSPSRADRWPPMRSGSERVPATAVSNGPCSNNRSPEPALVIYRTSSWA